jgi:hypothetical protein
MQRQSLEQYKIQVMINYKKYFIFYKVLVFLLLRIDLLLIYSLNNVDFTYLPFQLQVVVLTSLNLD